MYLQFAKFLRGAGKEFFNTIGSNAVVGMQNVRQAAVGCGFNRLMQQIG
jgi:hypothetical protein